MLGSPGPEPSVRTYEIHSETRRDQPAAVAEAALPVPEIGPWLAVTYGQVFSAMTRQGRPPTGPPFARYHHLEDDQFVVQAGFPVADPVEPDGDVHHAVLPGGQAATTIHVGPYDEIEPAYTALTSWVTEHGGEPAGDPWEVYYSDPDEQPDPATWRTEVVLPYRPPG